MLALSFAMTGCNLDPEVTDFVTRERHEELVDDQVTNSVVSKAALAKVYAIYQENWSTHDDFSLKAFHIATDMMCEDITYRNWEWFQFDYQLDNREGNYRRTNSTWRQFYEIIAKVNLNLETYFAGNITDEGVLKVKGEALALRAIAYFHLVNFYQHIYKGHEDLPGVPLSLKTTDKDLPRATVKEVYAQIVQDLTFAMEHSFETSATTDLDKYVVAAYLAKVYAQMEDWENVAKYAAIASKGGSDVISKPGRSWDISQADILWAYDVNAQNSALWASYWSHIDQFMPRGYAAGGAKKLIHNMLYKKIPSNDSRRKLWVNLEEYPEVAKLMKEKSSNDEVEMEDYDQLKFVAGDVAMEQDYCFIRVQDPILLEIEALVEMGKLAEAKTKLTDFVLVRNPDFVAPDSREALREEVRFQRRIELWGEGTNWLDMKRWKMTIDRTAAGSNHIATFKVATDNPQFYHKLPVREIESNPNLVQND